MAAALSKLDAVNILLDAMGEDPVSSLSSGLPDAETAERVLDETSKDIQEVGWMCNKDYDVTLSPSASTDTMGMILLPSTSLKVDLADSQDPTVDVVERERKLYDRAHQTFIFTKNVVCDITYELDYEDLPYRLAYYIAKVAAGRYQMRQLSSEKIAGWLQHEINDSKAKLDLSEDDADDANVLRDSASVRRIARRNNRYDGAR